MTRSDCDIAVVARRREDLEIGPATRTVVATPGIRMQSLEGLGLVRGRWDRALETHPAVVVRPDRHVFG